MVELPLLAEAGNAILDYLKNGRRISTLPFIFISARGPLKPLSSSCLYSVLNRILNKTNIKDLDKRKHGPHALRHSLASKLLENGIPLETISAVLGHSSSEVTTVYLSIGMNNLKKCALAMPDLNSRIYMEVTK